jgi:hypothetical protein
VTVPNRAPLTAEQVQGLPEGTPVVVIWTGGNGPHRYVIAVDHWGRRYVWDGESERLRYYNELYFVGQEPYHTRVWLP